MASKRPGRGLFISFGLAIVFALVGNIWISRELNKLESSSVLAPSAADDAVSEQRPVYGLVKIDPNNDPMAPAFIPPASKPVVYQAPAEEKPVFEGRADTPIITQ